MGSSLTAIKLRGRYAMVIYVNIRMLFPCLMAVRLSATLVAVESWIG